MKRTEAALRRLIAELEAESAIFDEIFEKYRLVNEKIKKIEPDELDWAGVAYTIHNLYNLMENYFLRIAKFFENDIDASSWHKDLIFRMTLDIEHVRPSFISKESAPLFNELRAFRHVFRNIYQSELDIDKLKAINAKVPTARQVFLERHREYIVKLKILTEELRSPS